MFTAIHRTLGQVVLRDAQQKHEKQRTQVRTWDLMKGKKLILIEVLEQGLKEDCATSILGDS